MRPANAGRTVCFCIFHADRCSRTVCPAGATIGRTGDRPVAPSRRGRSLNAGQTRFARWTGCFPGETNALLRPARRPTVFCWPSAIGYWAPDLRAAGRVTQTPCATRNTCSSRTEKHEHGSRTKRVRRSCSSFSFRTRFPSPVVEVVRPRDPYIRCLEVALSKRPFRVIYCVTTAVRENVLLDDKSRSDL